MGVDLHGDGEAVDPLQALFFDPVGNVGDGGFEGLAAEHDVAGIGGHAVDAEGVVGLLDLVELRTVQEEFHFGCLHFLIYFINYLRGNSLHW